jgi:hypothetical protein
VQPGDPYLAMVDAFASAVDGTGAWNRPVDDSIAMLELLGRIADSASAADPLRSGQNESDELPIRHIDERTT